MINLSARKTGGGVVAALIRGDNHTTRLEIAVARNARDVDLGGLAWRVDICASDGRTDVYTPTEVVVDDREIIEHIIRGFRTSGKVIERDLVIGACKLFRSNMWYLNHFVAICDSMSRGYMNEGILMEALKTIVSVNEPRFLAIVNDLTDHQLSLMRAIVDGVVKFSASDIIDRYSLNSSANVRRVKDALKKKEVITFNEKDEPVILDPLFEYWITKYFFEIQ